MQKFHHLPKINWSLTLLLTGLNIWMMNQLGYMTLVTNVLRNTGQLVVFGTAESLSNLAHGKGIFIMIVMLYQF